MKKKVNILNTTAGLNHVCTGTANTPAIDKIQIQIEVHVKDVTKQSSQTTDPAFGKWGRPWGKDDYLSGVLY
jgi:hypothetical protein